MIQFTTESNSIYQVDTNNKKIRRLSGKSNPTTRQGNDGEWKSYITLSPIVKGESVVIVWDSNTPLLPETKITDTGAMIATPTTITNIVAHLDIDYVES